MLKLFQEYINHSGFAVWAAECPKKNTKANKIAPFAQVDGVPHCIHSGESLTGGHRNTIANKIAPFAQVDVVPQWHLFVWRTLQLGSWMPRQELAYKIAAFMQVDVIPQW
jgi:hypothetical protein